MTWDNSDLFGMTLSGGNSIATCHTGSNFYVSGANAKTGPLKYYFELQPTGLINDGVILGVQLVGHSVFSGGDDLGNIYTNTGLTPFFGLTSGRHFGFCLDFPNNQFYLVSDVTKVGIDTQGDWNGDPTADPNTGTGGLILATGLQTGPTKPMFFATNALVQACQIYTVAADFLISIIPTGYVQWDLPLTIGRNRNKTYRTR